MTIQVNTDNNIKGSVNMEAHVEETINTVLGRFDEQITRVEVHLKDINGKKDTGGVEDIQCGLEVRMKGLDPLIVTNNADDVHRSVKGAADKMKAMLDKTNKIRQNH